MCAYSKFEYLTTLAFTCIRFAASIVNPVICSMTL